MFLQPTMAQITRIPPTVSLWYVIMAVPCKPRQLTDSILVTCHRRHVLITSLKRSTFPSYLFPNYVRTDVNYTLVQRQCASPKMDKLFCREQKTPSVTSTWSRCTAQRRAGHALLTLYCLQLRPMHISLQEQRNDWPLSMLSQGTPPVPHVSVPFVITTSSDGPTSHF